MRSTYQVFLVIFILLISFSSAYGGDGSKVYLEGDCLAVLGAGRKLASVEGNENANQTFVEEDNGYIAFDRVTVIEKRDNNITESYVQVRNCRMLKSGHTAGQD